MKIRFSHTVSSFLWTCFFAAFSLCMMLAAAHAQTTSDALDFMVMNVCVDAKDQPTLQNPLNTNPAAPKCAKQRNLKPGEMLPYYAGVQSGPKAGQRRYSFLSHIAATDQNGNRHPIVIAWTDSEEYGQWSSTDGVSVWTVQDGYASGMGSTGGSHLSVDLGTGSLNPENKGIARFNRSWVFYPEKLIPDNEVRYGVFSEKVVAFQREEFSPAALPSTPQLNSYFGISGHRRFGFGPKSSVQLDALIGEKYAAKDKGGLSPGGARAMERSYFTRELGITRWEAWKRDDSTDRLAIAESASIYAMGGCGTPVRLAETPVNPHLEIGPVQVVQTKKGPAYAQVITNWDDKAQKMVSHTWYLKYCFDWSDVHPQSPLDINALVETKQNTLLMNLESVFVAK